MDATEYEARLSETYRPELDGLIAQHGATAKIVNTGGGCMAIEAIVGRVPGTNHPLELLVTTEDHGLSADRSEIVHWYACLYDAVEGGEALADGHDLESFDAACNLAISHLREGVPASDGLCDCF